MLDPVRLVSRPSLGLPSLVVAFCLSSASAATINWTGASGTDTNWSTLGNWNGGGPTGADDVKFFDPGTNGTPGVPSSFVDGAFGGFIGSLQFGNTNGVHTLLLAPGTSLNITNGNLVVGTSGDVGAVRNLTNAITGPGATLNLSNTTAQLAINQGTASSLSGMRGNLDLSGLDTFNASLSRIGLGSTSVANPGGANQREAGMLLLARTNLITLSYTDTLANYQTNGKNNALEMSRNPGNNASIMSFLYLGQSNVFYLDSMGFGRDKASANSAAWMGFNPAFLSGNPVAYFRGAAGDSSRVTWWGIGDMNDKASSSQVAVGTNDFTGGRVDALVEMLSLGRDCYSSHTATGSGKINLGVLTFDRGTINVNTLIAGNQSLGPTSSQTPNQGFVNVGAAATLIVNSNLLLGKTTVASTAATNTYGKTSVNGGNLLVNSVSIGALSAANGAIAVNGGVFALTNNLASASKPLKDLALTNATLILHPASSSPIAYVTNLFTGGATNTISLGSVTVFGSYPTQVPLIKYVSLSGAGYNFVLGSVPGSAPDAYLVNNTLNSSIDLVLPTDPVPQVTSLPGSYGGSPGDNLSFTVGYSGSQPITLSWLKDGTNILVDGVTASGSTLSGSTTATLCITNAQAADSGNYAVVISNPYGAVTSTPPASLLISTNDIAPIINGPTDLTAVQGNSATLTATVSGKPVPTVQWYKDGVLLPGQTSPNLTLPNPQYPADQGRYSIVASNEVGMVTNSARLTIIVAPLVAVGPANLVVTNGQSAAFSVVCTNAVPAPTFQWRKNGSAIANATNATLPFTSVSPADMGSYTVLIANPAGSTVSAPATLTVNSTMTATPLRPANGATGICYDTPLYLTFDRAPSLCTPGAGKIRIYNATNSATPVDTLDMSLNTTPQTQYAANIQPRLIGGDSFNSFPVIITGNTVAIYPHAGALTSNQTYYVTIDDGVFTDAVGAYFAGITDSNVWQFATKPTGPANPTNLVVAADGSGDFVTVQGAVDSIPANNTNHCVINIRNGTYTEIVNIKAKHNLNFRGQSRTGAVIGYANNNNVNSSGAPWRAMFVVNADDCSFENLTITNTTPKGGSQAEAVDVEGTRAVFYNMEMDSYQDTFLSHSAGKLIYFQDSLIQGDTDFNWGYGTIYYTNCELRMLTSGGHVTQPRSPAGQNGFAFVNCTLTKGSSAVTSADLGRSINTPGTPSQAFFLNCLMDDLYTGYASDAGTNFADCANSNLTATAVKTLANSTHLLPGDPIVVAASSASTWLYGWQPQVAPYILGQPAAQALAAGQATTLAVTATGIPASTYQWLKDGTAVPGATNATLNISSASANDAGVYSVVVSNSAGSVTSSTAAVTVANTSPTLNAIPNFTVNAGVAVAFTNAAADPDVPAQSLSFALLSGPTNATLDAVSGVFSFRPLVSQAGSSNWFVVQVADSAVPAGTAQQGFAVVVNPLAQPGLQGFNVSGSAASFTITGDLGPNYTVQASTNLVDWVNLSTTNPPALPFQWSDPDTASFSQRFYRIQVGP